ncbi:hypothetical protein NLJ89_g11942 [Agrocybe chaxingu]|uniref:C2H2-type domain-containing protein n=1 Tax=Agrocybe chaxingu TaxID=84603 RepID=A0A9W8JMT3_9AGAR|nr:hypothetical protein NLJ89_g11942 [Agrocybe chaxingu]
MLFCLDRDTTSPYLKTIPLDDEANFGVCPRDIMPYDPLVDIVENAFNGNGSSYNGPSFWQAVDSDPGLLSPLEYKLPLPDTPNNDYDTSFAPLAMPSPTSSAISLDSEGGPSSRTRSRRLPPFPQAASNEASAHRTKRNTRARDAAAPYSRAKRSSPKKASEERDEPPALDLQPVPVRRSAANIAASEARRKKPLQYFCDVPGCDSGFTAGHNLRLHQRIHCDDKPYKCSGCTYRSVGPADVNRHIETARQDNRHKSARLVYRKPGSAVYE